MKIFQPRISLTESHKRQKQEEFDYRATSPLTTREYESRGVRKMKRKVCFCQTDKKSFPIFLSCSQLKVEQQTAEKNPRLARRWRSSHFSLFIPLSRSVVSNLNQQSARFVFHFKKGRKESECFSRDFHSLFAKKNIAALRRFQRFNFTFHHHSAASREDLRGVGGKSSVVALFSLPSRRSTIQVPIHNIIIASPLRVVFRKRWGNLDEKWGKFSSRSRLSFLFVYFLQTLERALAWDCGDYATFE